MAEIFDHGDPLWEPAYFVQTEAEAYFGFWAVTNAIGVHKTARKKLPGQQVIRRQFRPINLSLDHMQKPGSRRLLCKETQWRPRPNGANGDSPIVVRHNLAVILEVGGEFFLEDSFDRPELHVRENDPKAPIVPAHPSELLLPDLMPQIKRQAEYLGWLELARAQIGIV